MSRSYEMYVEVKEFNPDLREAIKQEADEDWGFDWWTEAPDLLDGCGTNQLCGGESEREFSERLARSIWQANGGYCSVLITATYLEDLPFESYEFDEEAFARLSKKPEDTPP